jgi:thiol-disulfide isomerase/thioredoxin
MKHSYYYILAALMCCILTGCKEKGNEVIITGQLEGVEDGAVIRLTKKEGRMFVDLRSDTVVNGQFRFSFTDTLDIPKPLNIMADGDGFPPAWLEIWAVPGAHIKITGKDKLLRSWDVNSNVAEQQELNKYKIRVDSYEKTSQSVMREAYAYFDKIDEYPERRAEFGAKIDSLYAINDSLHILIAEAEIDVMDANKTYSSVWMKKLDRYASALRYMKISEAYAEKLKIMYEEMSDDVKNSEEGQSIYINLYPPVVVKEGDDMADADMWNLEGELCHLADYKGRYLLLDFWSAGCGPCIMAIPEMKEISEIYKNQLVVISISSDPKEVWERTSKEKDIIWVNLNDFKGENGVKLRYGVRGIPHYVMISPEGKIITSWSGYGEGLLKRKMEELIK